MMAGVSLGIETVFSWAAPPIRFGLGASADVGWEASRLGGRSCLLITDPGVRAAGPSEAVERSLREAGVAVDVYDQVAVEPTDRSWQAIIDYVRGGSWDLFVAVGGGSAVDSAKVANLFYNNDGDILDYVAPPAGRGRAPSAPLRPLIAVPTTAGTGSEATAIAVVDLLSRRIKAAISHGAIRPSLAVVDPELTYTLPPEVTAAGGMDVLAHAIESYTAKPFHARPASGSPGERGGFAGQNPVSDLFCERAIALVGRYLRRAVANGYDLEARYHMALAAMFAGIGFGNAGTHLPHANAYPVAGMAHGYRARGYPAMPMVPHGQAVASTVLASFAFTYPTSPARHLKAASLLLGREADPSLGARALVDALADLLGDVDLPVGIGDLGYTAEDVDALTEGTLAQQRQLRAAPRPVDGAAVRRIYQSSLESSRSARIADNPG